mgnify:FL=1
MTATEIASIKKLIKEIRSKLYEVEKLIDTAPKNKNHFNSNKPPTSLRKRSPYRNSEQQ